MITKLLLLYSFLAWAAEPSFHDAVSRLATAPQLKSFLSADGTRISYAVFDRKESGPTLGPLVIAQGKGESLYRYSEFVEEMSTKGYGPIYLIEHRGQGYSEKLLDLSIHVNRFDEYVEDFISFIDGPVSKDLAYRGIKKSRILSPTQWAVPSRT
jgi:alpha-beta hydrolase superfamily lysophospholipase